MQDPEREITGVVKGLIDSPTADEQAAVLRAYYLPNASFDHPLCAVDSFSLSRDFGILPIYQWLKIMFRAEPGTIKIKSVAYDKNNLQLYVDATQHLVCRLWIVRAFYAPWARIVVLLHLTEVDGRYYINRQEDIYPVQVMPGQIIPGLYTVIHFVKLFIGVVCLFNALIGQYVLGVWTTSKQPSLAELKRTPAGAIKRPTPPEQPLGDQPAEKLLGDQPAENLIEDQ